MKGHIYQRTKGSWTIVYNLPVDSLTGKRRQKSQTIKGIKRDAERTLREIHLVKILMKQVSLKMN